MEGNSENAANYSAVEKRVTKRKAEEIESEVEETESERDVDNVPLVNDSTEEDEDKEGPTVDHFNDRQFASFYKNIKIDGHYLISYHHMARIIATLEKL